MKLRGVEEVTSYNERLKAGLIKAPGRSLPRGHQWVGGDVGGKAARRRLRQAAKLEEKREDEEARRIVEQIAW